MVAEQSCVKRLWSIVLELYHDGLERLERSFHLAGNALQVANIESLESAAGTSTAAASMVDMRVLGKPSIFAGDAASLKSWSFVMLPFSAAVSPELRALMVGHEQTLRTC